MPPLLFASYEDINSIASTVLWVLLGIGFIVLCIFAAIYAEKLRQQRIKDFIALAERHGFEYHPSGLMTTDASPSFWNFFHIETDGVVNALSEFPLFNVGHSKQAAPVLIKRSGGYEWLLFDYEYKITRSNGKSTTTTTYRFSVVLAKVPFQFPKLSLTPQTPWHNLGKMVGLRELETESEAFNKRYYVSTDDQRRSLEILHPQVIDFLESRPIREWHYNGDLVLTHLPGHLAASTYEAMFEEVSWLVSQVPQYYQQDNR
jgi:hypothetical protein